MNLLKTFKKIYEDLHQLYVRYRAFNSKDNQTRAKYLGLIKDDDEKTHRKLIKILKNKNETEEVKISCLDILSPDHKFYWIDMIKIITDDKNPNIRLKAMQNFVPDQDSSIESIITNSKDLKIIDMAMDKFSTPEKKQCFICKHLKKNDFTIRNEEKDLNIIKHLNDSTEDGFNVLIRLANISNEKIQDAALEKINGNQKRSLKALTMLTINNINKEPAKFIRKINADKKYGKKGIKKIINHILSSHVFLSKNSKSIKQLKYLLENINCKDPLNKKQFTEQISHEIEKIQVLEECFDEVSEGLLRCEEDYKKLSKKERIERKQELMQIELENFITSEMPKNRSAHYHSTYRKQLNILAEEILEERKATEKTDTNLKRAVRTPKIETGAKQKTKSKTESSLRI